MSTPLRLVVPAVALTLSCTSFRAVERGDWRRVYTKDAATVTSLDAPQEIITREQYEEELANDVRRSWSPSPGWAPPLLLDADAIGLSVGEVTQLRIDEFRPVELQALGNAATVYWGQRVKRDEWKEGTDLTLRESTVFLKGASKGTMTLRLVTEEGTKDVAVTVR